MPGAGTAILFVCTLVASVLAVAATLALAGRYYLATVTDTAAGVDRVKWGDEPLYDWIGRALHVGWLLSLWLVPAGLAVRGLGDALFPGDPVLRFLALASPGLLFFFPVSLLSSLSASSPLVPFRLAILKRLAPVFAQLAWFYLVTSWMGLLCAALWYASLVTTWAILLPVASAAGAAFVLIHARLLGRLGWLMHLVAPLEKEAEPEPSKAPTPSRPARKKARRKKKQPARPLEARDPWAVPEEDDPFEEFLPDLPEEGYGVVDEGPARIPDFHSRPLHNDSVNLPVAGPEKAPEVPEETYGVAGAENYGPAAGDERTRRDLPPPPRDAEHLKRALQKEVDLRKREPESAPPRRPMLDGVFTFPWYDTSMKAWVGLSAAALFAGITLRGLIAFWPY